MNFSASAAAISHKQLERDDVPMGQRVRPQALSRDGLIQNAILQLSVAERAVQQVPAFVGESRRLPDRVPEAS